MELEKILLGIGVAIVVIAVMLAINYFRKDSKGKEEAEQFLKDLEEQLYLSILEIINKYDLSDFKTLEEFETLVLGDVYKDCWEFIRKKIDEADSKNLITAIAKKFLTKENIDKFIEQVLKDKELENTLIDVYGAYTIENISEELIEEDKQLEEEYSDQEKYYEEFDPDKDAKKSDRPIAEPTEEQLAELNPQTDEDEVYAETDESVEEVADYIITKVSANGTKRFYLVNGETGKKKQVSKDYAMESNLEIVEK